jgi:hypothetical protein
MPRRRPSRYPRFGARSFPSSRRYELDRIINTPRTAQHTAASDNQQGVIGILNLAGARIERFAKVVEKYDTPTDP